LTPLYSLNCLTHCQKFDYLLFESYIIYLETIKTVQNEIKLKKWLYVRISEVNQSWTDSQVYLSELNTISLLAADWISLFSLPSQSLAISISLYEHITEH
jgi:hypothetical protein